MTEAQGQPTPEATGTQAAQGTQDAPETLTWQEHQAELKRIGTREKKQGRTARDSELLERARQVNPDVESIDDVFSAFTEYQGIQEAVTTEADRERTAREKYEKQYKSERDARIADAQTYALRDQLRDRGVPSDRLDDALALAKRDDLTFEDGKVGGVEDVVTSLLEPRPWLLSEAGEQRLRVNAPQTTGTGVSRPGGQTPEERHAQSLLNHLIGG